MNGIFLATALVPTVGHQFAINFAKEFLYSGNLYVIISTRDKEPTTFEQRVAGFEKQDGVYFINHHDNDAPQNPPTENQDDFWNYWKNAIQSLVDDSIDFVFASEPYEQNVADSLGCTFIPIDINREVYPIKGSYVRGDLFYNQNSITKKFRELIHRNIVIFGAESTGKTTIARRVSKCLNARYYPEWARPYLETVGSEATDERLQNIIRGQRALERDIPPGFPIISVYDTDLLTTYGFFKQTGREIPEQLKLACIPENRKFYFVMNSNIPFEPDILRYGGDVRETDTQFWIDILEKFHKKYHIIQSTDRNEQLCEIIEVIENLPLTSSSTTTYNDLETFERD